MTLSRRDEFAARAMVAAIESEWDGQPDIRAIVLTRIVDAQLAELDRTAPKPEPRESEEFSAMDRLAYGAEIEDDGREIRCCEDQDACSVELSSVHSDYPVFVAANSWIDVEDARLFAHRILKLCDEIEGK